MEIGILTDGFLLLGMNNQREWDGLHCRGEDGWTGADRISMDGGFVKKVH